METIRGKKRIILEFESEADAEKVQQAIDAQKNFDIIGKSKATDKEVQQLADEIKQTWWDQNKHRFIK